MIMLGSGTQRAVQDFMLTRYACYFIAQNGDPIGGYRNSFSSIMSSILNITPSISACQDWWKCP